MICFACSSGARGHNPTTERGNPVTSPEEEFDWREGRPGPPESVETCVICLERPKDATIVHGGTGHVCCCTTCAQELQRTGASHEKPSSECDSELIESSILMIANGNLKWQKNFEELRLAVDRLQLQSSKGWTSPGGYCKLFENGEVSIRWYSNSKTLTVKGEKADEIKEKLLNFDRKLSGEVKVYSESPKVANILESTDRNLHSRSRNCSVNNEMTRTNCQSYSTNTNDTNYNKSPEFYEINSKLENYSQNVTRKLDALAEEISTIKENKENAAYGILILEETVNDLKKEKYELNRENEELKEKSKNLFHSLS
ncbi:Hypothetical predicted protein [Paramuricea clavata]|uniref:Uncharacterized protein n=1 Tax=Paramuricea clavata TaxID=317549 RepID=A0A6S7IH68_PARCT|nr:Hypothetical predicted protein [Paramuricea clavata]